MATTDPFKKGGGGRSSGAGGGAVPGGTQPPEQGPRSVTGQPAGGRGPYGGRIGPPGGMTRSRKRGR